MDIKKWFKISGKKSELKFEFTPVEMPSKEDVFSRVEKQAASKYLDIEIRDALTDYVYGAGVSKQTREAFELVCANLGFEFHNLPLDERPDFVQKLMSKVREEYPSAKIRIDSYGEISEGISRLTIEQVINKIIKDFLEG